MQDGPLDLQLVCTIRKHVSGLCLHHDISCTTQQLNCAHGDQGLAMAQTNVSTKYYNGTGVTQSNTKAREWWTKAAEQGQEEAIANLQMLDEQEGIKTTSSSSNFTDRLQFERCESTTKKNGKNLMRCPAWYCCKEVKNIRNWISWT